MTTRKPNGNPSVEEQLAAIQRTARALAKVLPQASAATRAKAEKRIAAAYNALQPPTWKWAAVQRSIIRAIETPAKFLASRKWDEDWAIARAVEQIEQVMNDADAPAELNGRTPITPVLRRVLRTWRQRERGDDGGKNEAMLELWRALGVSNASDPDIVKKMVASMRK